MLVPSCISNLLKGGPNHVLNVCPHGMYSVASKSITRVLLWYFYKVISITGLSTPLIYIPLWCSEAPFGGTDPRDPPRITSCSHTTLLLDPQSSTRRVMAELHLMSRMSPRRIMVSRSFPGGSCGVTIVSAVPFLVISFVVLITLQCILMVMLCVL